MKRYYLLGFQVMVIFLFARNAFAFDDKTTHPAITAAAIAQSIIGCDTCTYLQDNLGFKNGLAELIANNPENTDQQIRILDVIENGARTEDTGKIPPKLLCSRGLNHFYDPTYDPTKGTGLDESVGFSTFINGVMSVTHGHFHGYANPEWGAGDCVGIPGCDPDFSKDEPTDDQQAAIDKNYYSLKKARESFKAALEESDTEIRKRLFVRTFRSVGQVAHLLQDMAVPAHVRIDMKV